MFFKVQTAVVFLQSNLFKIPDDSVNCDKQEMKKNIVTLVMLVDLLKKTREFTESKIMASPPDNESGVDVFIKAEIVNSYEAQFKALKILTDRILKPYSEDA